MKIVVLAGGLSPERNVSLSSGSMICQALRDKGHRVALVDVFFGLEGFEGESEELYDAPIPPHFKKVDPKAPDLNEVRASRRDRDPSAIGPGVIDLCRNADIAYLALHGTCGEDGRIQAMFDLMGIPYTGAGYTSSAIAMDKDLTKRMVAHLVTTPKWMVVTVTDGNLDRLANETRLPTVVKPLASGSSIGVFIAHDRAQLRHALEESRKLGGRTVLEQYIRGRELSVGILDGKALPSIEIIPKEGFYDYENKYQPGAAIDVTPAQIPAEWEERMGRDAVAVFNELGLSVYSRADFILTEDGTPYFLEINTLPGFTPTSLLPQEAAAAGISYGDLCELVAKKSLEARKEGR